VKKDWPDRALIVSLMVPCVEESWKHILPLVEATGADGIELNFGCPHGMPERGMGAAVGQVPEYVEQVTRWCKTYSLPVIVKLTPNITDIRVAARAAHRGGADAVSLINTINSITSVDLERMVALPIVGSQSTHGGYCGSAVKPIALNMVAEIARDPQTRACRSAASAASATGATRRNSWPWAAARCRCARRRCCMASGLSRR
jgi:dihydropyrimidine dehydrogenase (NAD+) subunit PreA